MIHNNSNSLAEKIAQDLFDMIYKDKKYQVGDKLPNEIELSEMFEISRGTMREALKILKGRGIIKVYRGLGTFVQNVESLVTDEDLYSLIDTNIDFTELLEVRFLFEPQMAYLAALRATDGEIREIQELCEKVNERIRIGKDRTEEELAFHNSIANATHNDFLKKLLPIINVGINTAVLNAKDNEEISQRTIFDHNRITKSIKDKNPLHAKNAMESHILNIAEVADVDILRFK